MTYGLSFTIIIFIVGILTINATTTTGATTKSPTTTVAFTTGTTIPATTGTTGITTTVPATTGTTGYTTTPASTTGTTGTTGVMPTLQPGCVYVGQFIVGDPAAPVWTTHPPPYTAQEGAAILYGGSPSDYSISIRNYTVTYTGWYSGYCVPDCEIYPDDFKIPGLDYDCGSYNCSVSAFVKDNCYGRTNFVFKCDPPPPCNACSNTSEKIMCMSALFDGATVDDLPTVDGTILFPGDMDPNKSPDILSYANIQVLLSIPQLLPSPSLYNDWCADPYNNVTSGGFYDYSAISMFSSNLSAILNDFATECMPNGTVVYTDHINAIFYMLNQAPQYEAVGYTMGDIQTALWTFLYQSPLPFPYSGPLVSGPGVTYNSSIVYAIINDGLYLSIFLTLDELIAMFRCPSVAIFLVPQDTFTCPQLSLFTTPICVFDPTCCEDSYCMVNQTCNGGTCGPISSTTGTTGMFITTGTTTKLITTKRIITTNTAVERGDIGPGFSAPGFRSSQIWTVVGIVGGIAILCMILACILSYTTSLTRSGPLFSNVQPLPFAPSGPYYTSNYPPPVYIPPYQDNMNINGRNGKRKIVGHGH